MKKAAAFQKHSKSMADTAASLAKSGAVTDKRMADGLIRTAAKVEREWWHNTAQIDSES